MREVVLIVHNVRSSHNVGSLLRTADGLGLNRVYLTGYTPYPVRPDDTRLPHIARSVDAQIHKTALGAETTQAWKHDEDIFSVIKKLKQQGFSICALEQTPQATPLPSFIPSSKTALIVGRETEGIESEVLQQCDVHIEIPMSGKKESFNVAQAAAMGLFHTVYASW